MAIGDGLNNAGREAEGLYNQLRGVTSELKGQATIISKSRQAFRDFEKAAQDLLLAQKGLAQVSDQQVASYSQQLTKQLEIAKQEGERLATSTRIGRTLSEEANILREMGESEANILDYKLQEVLASEELTDEQKAILSGYFDQFGVLEEILDSTNQELAIRQEITKTLGISGKALTALSKIPLFKALDIDKIAGAMRATADDAVRTGKSFKRLRTVGAGFVATLQAGADALFSIEGLTTAVVASFSKFTKANKDVRNLTGQTATNFDNFDGSITTATQKVETIAALTEETGINVNAAFSKATIKEATELMKLQGLTAKETANLATFSEAFSMDLADVNKLAFQTTKEFARNRKGILAVGKVTKGVANTAESIKLQFRDNPKALLEAVAATQALGGELNDVKQIASGFLDFETKLRQEAELFALTGIQMNTMELARLANAKEYDKLYEEIANTRGLEEALANGTLIAEEALVDITGINADQLAEIVKNKGIINNIDEDAVEVATEITEVEQRRLGVMENLKNIFEKLLEPLNPILEKISAILDTSLGIKGAYILLGGLFAGKLLMGATTFVNTVGPLLGGGGAISKLGGKAMAGNISRAGRTMATFGVNVGAAGASASPAIPVILALTAAVVGIGFALGQASPAISAFGDMFKSVLEGIGSVIESIGNAITGFIDTIAESITKLSLIANAETAAGFSALGLSFLPLSIGLGAMAIALTALGNPLAVAGAAVAERFGLTSGESAKESASGVGSLTQNAVLSASLKSFGKKLDQVNEHMVLLIQAVEAGSTINIDGNEIGKSVALATSKLG